MSKNNRKATEDFIKKYVEKIAKGNAKIYERLFESMNDTQFDAWMERLNRGEIKLSIVSPNFSKDPIDVERNLKIADELGHNFFEKLWIEGEGDNPTYLTPVEYLVMDLPVRRQSQTIVKKRSVPKTSRPIDSLTGQVSNQRDTRGAKISYPELQLASAMGLEKSLEELIKYRGGDVMGNIALHALVSQQGEVSQASLNQYATGVESTKTLHAYLTAAHLKNNLR